MITDSFQAVLDESGYRAAAKSDVFVFGGYVGKSIDWANAGHRWSEILKIHPDLDDADLIKGLVRWQGRYSDPRVVKLMRAVTDCPGLGSIRWKLPYAEYCSGVPAQLSSDHSLYFFAWFGVLFQLLGAIRYIANATIELFYDENIVEEPKVRTGFEELRKWLANNYPEIRAMLPSFPQPRNDQFFWPLCAADALAWNTHRHFVQTRKRRRHSNELWTALDSGPVCLNETWNAEDMRDVLIRGRIA